MLHNIKSLVIKSKAGKKMMAAAMTAALVMGAAVLPGEIVRAEETPFVDISTALISLSPQADEVTMSVAARNMPAETELAVSVADGNICSVEWVEPDSKGYKIGRAHV